MLAVFYELSDKRHDDVLRAWLGPSLDDVARLEELDSVLPPVDVEVLVGAASIEHALDQGYRPMVGFQGLASQPVVEMVDVTDDGGQGDDLRISAALPGRKQVRKQ